jgi:chromosome segregation ATPase
MVLALLTLATVITTVLPYVSATVGAITLAGVMYRTRGYIKGAEVQGQLEAKDAIIKTNEQAIDSFRARVERLEEDLGRVTAKARKAETLVEQLHGQLDALQRYAAPEAIERFESLSEERYADIKARLERIEAHVIPS